MKTTLMRSLRAGVEILIATNLMTQSARLAGMVADSVKNISKFSSVVIIRRHDD